MIFSLLICVPSPLCLTLKQMTSLLTSALVEHMGLESVGREAAGTDMITNIMEMIMV